MTCVEGKWNAEASFTFEGTTVPTRMKTIRVPEGSIEYLNSGDWIENLSALEFMDGRWSLYTHDGTVAAQVPADAEEEADSMDPAEDARATLLSALAG